MKLRLFYKITAKKIKFDILRILIIVLMFSIACGFFAGLNSTSPSLLKQLGNFLDDTNTCDIQIKAYGTINSDFAQKVSNLDNVFCITAEQNKDISYRVNNELYIVRDISALGNININNNNEENSLNNLKLVDGRMPEDENECVFIRSLCFDGAFDINDNIKLDSQDQNTKEVKVVGEVISPLYIHYSQIDDSIVGFNSLDACLYFGSKNSQDNNTFNTMFIKLNNSNDVDDVIDKIEKIDSTAKFEISKLSENLGIKNFHNDCDRLISLSNYFSWIFFISAIFVIATILIRKISEDTKEIYTYITLGVSRVLIFISYLVFALICALLGCLVGIFIFMPIVLQTLLKIYQDIYLFIDSNYIFYDTKTILIAVLLPILISIACTGLSLISKLLMPIEKLASLDHENIKHIGLKKDVFGILNIFSPLKKLSFNNCIAKPSRLLLTIICVTLCTSMILMCTNSLQASIVSVNNQMEKIAIDNYKVKLSPSNKNNDINNFINKVDKIFDKDGVSFYNKVFEDNALIETDEAKYHAFFICPDNMDEFFNLRDIKSDANDSVDLKEELASGKGVVITKGLARLLHIEAGDNVYLNLVNHIQSDSLNLKVVGIAENYIDNYIYCSKEYLESHIKIPFTINSVLAKTDTKIDSKLNSELIDNAYASAILSSNTLTDYYQSFIQGMQSICELFCVFSALVTLISIFCLTRISIIERRLELSILDQLGLTRRKFLSYIPFENIFISIFGIIFGLLLGTPLSKFMIDIFQTKSFYVYELIDNNTYLFNALFVFIVIVFFAILMIAINYNYYSKVLKNGERR